MRVIEGRLGSEVNRVRSRIPRWWPSSGQVGLLTRLLYLEEP